MTSIISKEHQLWYAWWWTHCKLNRTNCVCAGGAALHQYLCDGKEAMTKYLSETRGVAHHHMLLWENCEISPPSNFDIYMSVKNPTEMYIRKCMEKCGIETGSVAGPTTIETNCGVTGNTILIVHFHLHCGVHATRSSQIVVPIKLIVIDTTAFTVTYTRDSFWKSVVSQFDLDIIKVAIPDPYNMSNVHFQSTVVKKTIHHRNMTYQCRDELAQASQVMVSRLERYAKHGFNLKRILADDEKWAMFGKIHAFSVGWSPTAVKYSNCIRPSYIIGPPDNTVDKE